MPVIKNENIYAPGFVLNGTEAQDWLNDLLFTTEGGFFDPGTDDTINGLGGDDRIYIHNGNDTVNGGAGHDLIYDYGTGNDVMNGNGGNDTFYVGLGNDTINGGTGIDRVSYQNSEQPVGLDLESGHAISGGIDTLISIENAEGSAGNDVLLGSSVANTLRGFDGDDRLEGRGGNDWLIGDAGNDTLDGGAGSDWVSYQNSQTLVDLDLESGSAISEGTDTLISIENAEGSAGNDVLRGSSVANTLRGFDGDDWLEGRGGGDQLNGGAGNDWVSYYDSQQPVGVDLEGGYAISGGIDTLISIENAFGSAGNDLLLGSSAANQLVGGDGNDTLGGGAGADSLVGGSGDDVMTGGAGADTFDFTNWSAFDTIDTITDFEQGVDKINLNYHFLDARPDLPGPQSFTFDATPDSAQEEFLDGLDNPGAFYSNDPGPVINGDPGEIEYRHSGGYTYIYLSAADGKTDAEIRLEGTIYLTAADFIL